MIASITYFDAENDTCPICGGVFSQNLQWINADRKYTKDTTKYKECSCPPVIQKKLQDALNELHSYYEVDDDEEEELIKAHRNKKYLKKLDEIMKEYK